MVTITIEDVRGLDGQLAFLQVKAYQVRKFRLGRLWCLVRKDAGDVTGWICDMNSGTRPDNGFVVIRPSRTGNGPTIHVYFRDLQDLRVIASYAGDFLPGTCPSLSDLTRHHLEADKLSSARWAGVDAHLQWCAVCRGPRSQLAKAAGRTSARPRGATS